jgi:hypothetical protein
MMSLFLPLLALAAPPPAPPPPAAPAAAAPVDEARFRRFIRVLPDSPEAAAPAPAPDPAEAARLLSLNPGRERDIAAALQADARCTAPVGRAAVMRMMRHVANRLGPEKLDRMIAFYEGVDLKVFDRLGTSAGTLAAADEAELARIRSAYPIDDFAAAMQESGNVMWEDAELMAASMKCADARKATFTRAKLRAY